MKSAAHPFLSYNPHATEKKAPPKSHQETFFAYKILASKMLLIVKKINSHSKELIMNRNEQGTNEQNRTYSGRENLARRQAGPSASGRPHHRKESSPRNDRNSERTYSYDSDYDSEPQPMRSRERMRHDHDQNLAHDFHDREKSYRARREEEEFARQLQDSAWDNTPGGELSWEEQYRTDGEAHNYKGSLYESYNEYPQYGHNLDHRRPRHRDYAGFGPRGYKRSDARIEEELCELLARDHYIDASDIVVAVENGVVKLSGTVNQREDRVEAEMLAESVIGVEDIQNDISVRKRQHQEKTH